MQHWLGRKDEPLSLPSREYTEIAKGNPQWPQAFYPIEKNVTVNPGDFLVARCTYNSTGTDKYTNIGEIIFF